MFLRKFLEPREETKPRFFERMKQAFGATKNNLVARIENALSGRTVIDDNLLDELEGILLGADLGIKATTEVLDEIRRQRDKQLVKTAEDVRAAIRKQLLTILENRNTPAIDANIDTEVWMVVGVNGTGKTTTVGKLAARLAGEGNKVLICAADTFRPAAIEQLTVWAERSGAELIKNRAGSDPSAVLHDALSAASSRKSDVVIVDTACRGPSNTRRAPRGATGSRCHYGAERIGPGARVSEVGRRDRPGGDEARRDCKGGSVVQHRKGAEDSGPFHWGRRVARGLDGVLAHCLCKFALRREGRQLTIKTRRHKETRSRYSSNLRRINSVRLRRSRRLLGA
jgi:hypothetical protein